MNSRTNTSEADKAAIVLYLQKRGFTKKDAEKALDEILCCMAEFLQAGSAIKLYRFGILRPIRMEERGGHDLTTGEYTVFPPRTTVRFYASKSLRDFINKEK